MKTRILRETDGGKFHEQPESKHQMTAEEALKFYETGLGGEPAEPAWEDKFKEEDELIRLLHATLLAAVVRIKELEAKLKVDKRRCPMCGKTHDGSRTLCPACESDPHN